MSDNISYIVYNFKAWLSLLQYVMDLAIGQSYILDLPMLDSLSLSIVFSIWEGPFGTEKKLKSSEKYS